MYELTYIVNPNLSEAEVAAQSERTRGFINALSGEIKNERLGEKRKLAYLIKKEKFGFFVTLEFNIESDKVEELEKQMRLEPQILRHLLIVKQEAKPTPSYMMRSKERPIRTQDIAASAKSHAQPTEKVKMEELDKKLDEILEA
ncbi:MAG: 30S ribosomal protein S6 [Candidatus Portnoybacteria bacterium]|nr:30S ribosomal protein S6 [Candidatus Portnoybacteria bacterium]